MPATSWRTSASKAPRCSRAEDVDEIESTAPNKLVRLLPAFDQYVIAVNRDLIPTEHLAEVTRTAGWISPVVLHGGRVAGVPKKALAAEVVRVLPGRSLG
ncbi:winged helix DNA-binding domain-containing protein [Allokutzneria sp. A3M-2-11 16]|uniref:DNA glycosylase AlkZ-like family protein n=1 Tax=Allokutzneria sp. A3M-2-11 16 TaxID=2962043 RepID=UPI0020B6A100|nr:crosslink repair DNA glycosylase YcaQ family protein [Allokutzneria sp. A3M-2-11 16]MCP3802881.1 winged helix DNA-binding domain-containing protein [Allokutzneria sp. A3M-2-11 16]